MKTLKKILPFAKPLHHFVPEYLLYTFLSIVFGLLNFTLILPILNILFNEQNVYSKLIKPSFNFSIAYFKNLFNYEISSIISESGKFKALLLVCIVVGLCVIISNIFKYFAVKVLMRLRLKLMAGVRNTLFNAYLKQSLQFHHNNTTGESMMLITSEVQEIEFSLVTALQVLFRDPFVVVTYLCLLFYWSFSITLFTLIFLPISGFAISAITRRLKKLNYFSQDKLSSLLSFTNESLNGIRQIQSFTSEKITHQKFVEMNEDFSANSKKLYSKRELASPVSEILGVFAALTLITFGGYLILNGKSSLTGTAFITYLLCYTQMIQPLKNISNISTTMQRGIVAVERIFKVIDKPINIINKQNAFYFQDFNKTITLKNVSFKYEEKTVLNNINLTIFKGKKVALVGASGSGKSTLADLICRFYDVETGFIKIDDNDIRDITLESLREKIALVSQSTFLFNDSIAGNIAFGLPNVTEKQIIDAAIVANAHDFILQTPNGYQTIVGEGGVKLSGGQRQRITIARAVLKNAPILILDEATSALDSESEKLVQNALENLMKNRTSIVIAHRLSTIKNADEIIVMSEGCIVERGNHEDLILQNKIYKKLVDLQEIK
jgi:ATP-binding cassette, subfamily B, bacterial MsbA